MEEVKRLFEVNVAFTTGPDEAKINYEVGAVVPFNDSEEFANKIADGSLVEVTEHVVNEEDIAANPDAGLVIGDVIHLPLPIDDLSDEDKASLAAAEEKAAADAAKAKADEEAAIAEAEAKASADATVANAGPVYMYAGKVVVRDSTRTVEGKEYHHLTLATGESLDITDEEYEAMINPK